MKGYVTNLPPAQRDNEKRQEQHDRDLEFRSRIQSNLRKVFTEDQSGAWVLGYLMTRGNLFQSVFTGNSKTYYLSGAQDFVTSIANEIYHLDPAIYHAAIELVMRGEYQQMKRQD